MRLCVCSIKRLELPDKEMVLSGFVDTTVVQESARAKNRKRSTLELSIHWPGAHRSTTLFKPTERCRFNTNRAGTQKMRALFSCAGCIHYAALFWPSVSPVSVRKRDAGKHNKEMQEGPRMGDKSNTATEIRSEATFSSYFTPASVFSCFVNS